MKLPNHAVALALVASVLGACGDDDGANVDDAGRAEAFWTSLQAQDYRSFARAPGYETRRPAQSPHGDEVDIYVNRTVADALAGGPATSWPDGSLIVKDGWAAGGGALEVVAAMEKRDGAWYWAEFDAEGTPLFAGAPAVCTDCHGVGDDFVRSFPLPR